jgi:Protein of unknown function (DUF3078)
MRKLILLLTAFVWTLTSLAQDGAAKKKEGGASKAIWKKGGIFTFNVGQGGSKNWAAGADEFSLTANAFLMAYANKEKGRYNWDNVLTASYAMVNTSSLGVRKVDDKLDLFSKYSYRLKNPKWAAAIVGNLRTQFSPGYNYNGGKFRISDLFAPAYITVAPGMEWKPKPWFNAFLSPVAARWVVVTNGPYELRNNLNGKDPYGVDPDRGSRLEAGPYANFNFNKEICKNVQYISRLDLFSNFVEQEPDKVDVFWSNSVAFRVNKFLQVTYNLDLIYDHDVQVFGPNKNRPGTQVRSLLGVGFSTKF